MLTPKEKAEELAIKYWDLNYGWDGVTNDKWSKEGALIAVDEIIKSVPIAPLELSHPAFYWQEVKQEIENL